MNQSSNRNILQEGLVERKKEKEIYRTRKGEAV
jgi:hypothetical protein